MKSMILLLYVLGVVGILACNNAGNNNSPKNNEVKTLADSLKEGVDDDHNAGMAKMGKLTRAEQITQRLLDSISKLPGKARQAAEPLKAQLDSLQKDLQYAEFAMNKWMNEYKWDSAFSSVQEKIDYLTKEKLKVSKVKESILDGIQKADSLLKEKF